MPQGGPLDPDPDGCQLEALKQHLMEHKEIKYVFVECAPRHMAAIHVCA